MIKSGSSTSSEHQSTQAPSAADAVEAGRRPESANAIGAKVHPADARSGSEREGAGDRTIRERLVDSAWKETAALLSRGFAHDVNNQLACIVSLAELAGAKLAPDDACTGPLNQIKRAALQASQLIQRMGQLLRSRAGQRELVDCNSAISEAAELARKILHRRVEVRTEPDGGPLAAELDPVAFRRVLLDLSLNAAEAMPSGGILTLGAATCRLAPAPAHFRGTIPTAPCICIAVRDEGQGIAPVLLTRIFDPFFTTKPQAKGCGVGLTNAVRFVQDHHGAISVESTEGKGATFQLWLPRVDLEEPAVARETGSSNQRP